jgi:hypothetical protein
LAQGSYSSDDSNSACRQPPIRGKNQVSHRNEQVCCSNAFAKPLYAKFGGYDSSQSEDFAVSMGSIFPQHYEAQTANDEERTPTAVVTCNREWVPLLEAFYAQIRETRTALSERYHALRKAACCFRIPSNATLQ